MTSRLAPAGPPSQSGFLRLTRRAACMAFAVLAAASETGITDLQKHNAIVFERHWNPYIRDLFGCPRSGDTTRETCVSTPVVNYGEYVAARTAAKELFDLREPDRPAAPNPGIRTPASEPDR